MCAHVAITPDMTPEERVNTSYTTPLQVREDILHHERSETDDEGKELILLKKRHLAKLVNGVGKCNDCGVSLSLSSKYDHCNVSVIV